MMVRIVDYGAGNLTSVKRALDHLGIGCEITADPRAIRTAGRIVFPGVGHAARAMAVLRERGLDRALVDSFSRGMPILGICLGTQIVLSHSEEGDTPCLGLIEGTCPMLRPRRRDVKIPHMGWNRITLLRDHPVLKTVADGDEVYFVHSFFPKPSSERNVVAVSDHDRTFPSAVARRSLVAVQFHPEKSGPVGLRILETFCAWDGVYAE